MKKLFISIVAMLLPLMASADAVEINGIFYNLIDKANSAEVTKNPNYYSGDIVIPDKIIYEGINYNVTSIGKDAFYNCFGLSTVAIPNSITIIQDRAFFNCANLKSITIPNSVTSIGKESFYGCKSLTSFVIPNSVTSIGTEAFGMCNNIVSISIPNSISKIDGGLFENCSNLKTVDLPNSLTEIGTRAFWKCEGLGSVSIPEGVIYIASDAFSGCSSLTTVGLPSSITYINSGAFANCKKLESVFCYANSIPGTGNDVFKDSYIDYCTLYVPSESLQKYCETSPWKEFGEIKAIVETPSVYKLTYMVDGVVYKAYDVQEGASITPEVAPTKEGYTFSGWSEIPSTMPNHDVTVTGSFTINKYKLTYMVDGVEYKSYQIEYGASITPEAAPTKTGYTFSGWSNIPSTMPANDVTVTGTFTINKYKLIYKVDGVEYKTYDVEYGKSITPEPAPTKEGYTFSGWSYIPSTMPAENVTVTGSFTVNKYKLIYKVDGEVYKTYEIEYGATITPEAEPTKEGYSFSGWSEIPSTMPARDVTVTGTFSRGAYTLTYVVDGVTYKTVSYDYGETITPEPAPTKEGYTFSGWSNIPSTMPANNVTVTGSFTVNKYKLIYKVDGEVYRTYEIEYGATITPEAEPTKEGYKFSGWSYIPSKMPAEDVVVTGTFTQEAEVKDNVSYEVNGNSASVTHANNAKGDITIEESVVIDGKTYDVTTIADGAFQGCTGLTSVEIPASITKIGENAFDGCSGLLIIKIGKGIKEIGSKAFANIGKSKVRTRAESTSLKVYCEAEAIPSTAADAFENSPIDKGTLYVKDDFVSIYKVLVPWNGFGTIAGLATSINSVSIDSENAWIFDMQGNRRGNVRKGVNIIRMKDGKSKKVMVK
ncbi:MAG: leucine-rich repeat protein [Prevotella sp.]|nr:leucine-rich repeat protein [Prevotella sp.]